MDLKSELELGYSLWAAGKPLDAANAFRRAGKLSPGDATIRANYGIALAQGGATLQALPVLEASAKELAHVPDIFFNLGFIYRQLLRLNDALRAFSHAIDLQPDYADAHLCRSFVYLLAGDLTQGWKEFDWRFRLPDAKPPPVAGAPWDGSLATVRGKTLLLSAEQGFGDTIQFVRYIPILADAGVKVVLLTQLELKSLMVGLRGVSEVVTPPTPLQADYYAPLMSLCRLMGTNLHNIPADVPYLPVRPSSRLAGFGGTKKIGLAWAGRPTHRNDGNRSIALKEFAPLADVPGITLVSLQKGPAVEQIKSSPLASKIIDVGSELKDFADTAALIAELDLLISVDTSVVHLAGALGKPVWTLLPYSPDWRWLLNRTDTPWYPTMKLFRQPRPGEWKEVIENLISLL